MSSNVIQIKTNIVVNFLLTFALLLVVLHQWVGWEAKGHETKNKSLEIDKNKCLKQLNVAGNEWAAHPRTKCHTLYLRDVYVKDELAKPFDFSIPPSSKYITARKGIECGTNGFWIRYENKCIKTFAPVSDQKILKELMRAVGFGKYMPYSLIPPDLTVGHRLVFFSDSCAVDKTGGILKCAVHKQRDVERYILYRISPQLIPYPSYEADLGC